MVVPTALSTIVESSTTYIDVLAYEVPVIQESGSKISLLEDVAQPVWSLTSTPLSSSLDNETIPSCVSYNTTGANMTTLDSSIAPPQTSVLANTATAPGPNTVEVRLTSSFGYDGTTSQNDAMSPTIVLHIILVFVCGAALIIIIVVFSARLKAYLDNRRFQQRLNGQVRR
jgi:hypothetical protein